MEVNGAVLERMEDPLLGLEFEAGLIDADSVPRLYDARQRATGRALGILAQNHQFIADGRFEQAPIEVDVLGTARRVIEARNLYGEDSPEHRELQTGLLLDCERVIGEAERKLTWEFFGDSEQKRIPETRHYSVHGVPMPETVTGGLTPLGEPEEQDRRVNEFVEEIGTYEELGDIVTEAEAILQSLGGTAVANTVSSLTVSQCTNYALAGYRYDKKGAHSGYVPAIDKFMTREVIFIPSGDRIERQLALSGVYITPKVIMKVLADLGVIEQGEELSRTELHGKQLIDTSSRGVLWFASLLDKEASLQSGKRIFMGEEVDKNHPMNYDDVPIEAEARRRKLAPKPQELADYIVGLQEKDVDPLVAEGLVSSFVKNMMLEIALSNPDKAAIIFDQATADGFKIADHLDALGLRGEADVLRAKVAENAPEVPYCGAGSCGLTSVSPGSAEAVKARQLGLVGDLIYDEERSCNCCGQKTVYYDRNASKACISCSNTEIK